jgi:hypothetical protein
MDGGLGQQIGFTCRPIVAACRNEFEAAFARRPGEARASRRNAGVDPSVSTRWCAMSACGRQNATRSPFAATSRGRLVPVGSSRCCGVFVMMVYRVRDLPVQVTTFDE